MCWCTINQDTCKSHEIDKVRIVVQQDLRLLRESIRTNTAELVIMDQLLGDDPQLSALLTIGNPCG